MFEIWTLNAKLRSHKLCSLTMFENKDKKKKSELNLFFNHRTLKNLHHWQCNSILKGNYLLQCRFHVRWSVSYNSLRLTYRLKSLKQISGNDFLCPAIKLVVVSHTNHDTVQYRHFMLHMTQILNGKANFKVGTASTLMLLLFSLPFFIWNIFNRKISDSTNFYKGHSPNPATLVNERYKRIFVCPSVVNLSRLICPFKGNYICSYTKRY